PITAAAIAASLTGAETSIAALAAELGLAVPAAVLTGMIPELARIIGEQEPAPELTGAAAQRRLTLAVRALLRASTAGDRPLVLFLDDLQWADLASLELLEALLQEQLPRLLLIGAYRSNEVDRGHPLTAMLQAVAATCTTHAVELGPLARGDVLRLIADALHMEREIVAPLARQIYDKAEGNPFFTIRLLLALHEDGLLAWDQEARRYHWDEGAVGAVAAADNVVAFMGERLGRLPAASRRVLELAACIGHRFELGTLAQIGEQAIAAVVAALWPALEQGVIVALDEGYRYLLRTWPEGEGDAAEVAASVATVGFRFLHDRVQQAAYDGIAEDQRPRLHLQIGRLLRASSSDDESEDTVEAVSHLNLGRGLIDDADERRELARLNAAIGKRARAAAAHQAAATAFAIGVELLGEGAFAEEPQLAFTLHLGAAEA
ncbi:MAG: AAA family ATPase, partial [Myxococcales bacterium]|nr:AAA family ATPase [Myxococcales bacterium]